MITKTLESHVITLVDCRAQDYDNAASMSVKYNSLQAIIKKQYPLLYSLLVVATHSIYLCDNDAAERIPKVSTYFGTIPIICILFCCSPKR